VGTHSWLERRRTAIYPRYHIQDTQPRTADQPRASRGSNCQDVQHEDECRAHTALTPNLSDKNPQIGQAINATSSSANPSVPTKSPTPLSTPKRSVMTNDTLLFRNTRNDMENRHTQSRYVDAWSGVTEEANGRRENKRARTDGGMTSSKQPRRPKGCLWFPRIFSNPTDSFQPQCGVVGSTRAFLKGCARNLI
jgi:hypothetical protein